MSDEGVTHVPAGEATAAWHQPLVQIIAGTLSGDTAQTSGMKRLEAISSKTVGSEKLWMGETHVAPATNSGDHHHGEAETAIYVVSGRPRFVFLEDGVEKVLQTSPGDYVFVPPQCGGGSSALGIDRAKRDRGEAEASDQATAFASESRSIR